jgi:branched-chain amino acid transport system permease protein
MSRDIFILAMLDGMSYAGLLFLVALGLTFIFGVVRILNVAHGSLYAFGGYGAASLGLWLGQGYCCWSQALSRWGLYWVRY